MRRRFRAFGAVAAALVLFIGSAAIFRMQETGDIAPAAGTAADKGEVFTYVAADGSDKGERSMSVASDESASAITASAKLIASDISASSETVEGLVGDFGGYVDDSSVNASAAYITAYVPGEELAPFMESLEYVGDVDASRVSGEGDGMASVAITIKAE